MNSSIAHSIKHRKYANDEFKTPVGLAKKCISLLPLTSCEILLDNGSGGAFYDNFPKHTNNLFTKDFYGWNRKVDWCITNPPYSHLDRWLEHSCEVSRLGFAYLLGLHNLTPRRIEMCEDKGFHITQVFICKVFRWFGISSFIVWEKEKSPIIKYDRIVWR